MEPNINSFLSRTGCMIHQRQGQRFCLTLKALEHIKLPRRGHEVYVGKLPRDCYEHEIYPMFSKAGDIYETRMMIDISGSNRGFCYVKYFTRQAADNAVKLLHNQEIRPGHRLIVRKSLKRNTLTVYNVDEREDEITAAKELQTIVENMTEVRIVEVRLVGTLRQVNIEFDCHRSAIKAMKYFAIDMQRVFGPNARITWYCPVTAKEQNIHKALQNQNNNVGNMYSLPRNNSERKTITAFPRYSYLNNQNVEDSSMFAPNFTLGTQHYNHFIPTNSKKAIGNITTYLLFVPIFILILYFVYYSDDKKL